MLKRFIIPPIILGFFALIIVSYYASKEAVHEAEIGLLIDETFLPSIMKDIYSAKSSIICSLFIFKVAFSDTGDDDSAVTMVYNLLKDRSKDIDITLIFDAGDSSSKYNPNKQTAQLFKKSNVKIFFNDDSSRLYSKICVIDRSVTYIGSHNLTFSSFELNKESSVRISSAKFGEEVYNYLTSLIISK